MPSSPGYCFSVRLLLSGVLLVAGSPALLADDVRSTVQSSVPSPIKQPASAAASEIESSDPVAWKWITAARENRFGQLQEEFAALGATPLPDGQMAALLYACQRAYEKGQRRLCERWLKIAQPLAAGLFEKAIADGLVWCQLTPADLTDPAPRLIELADHHPHSGLAPIALSLRGDALEKSGRTEEAVWVYHELARRFPTSSATVHAMLHAAQLHAAAAQQSEAREWSERLIETQPQSPAAAEVLLLLANLDLKSGNTASAREHWKQIVAAHADHPAWFEAAYRLAESQYRARFELEEASALLTQLASRPAVPLAWLQRGTYLQSQIALHQHDWIAAAAALAHCLALKPDHELTTLVLYWQAELAYRQKKWDEAEQRLRDLVRLSPLPGDAIGGAVRHRLALLAARREAWNEAIGHLDAIERHYTGYQQRLAVTYLKGRCLYGLARLDEARITWREVIEHAGDEPEGWSARASWMTGESYLLQRRYAEALPAYDAAAKSPSQGDMQAAALAQAAACCELLNQPDEAQNRYARLVSSFPESPFAALARRGAGTPPRVAIRPEITAESENR